MKIVRSLFRKRHEKGLSGETECVDMAATESASSLAPTPKRRGPREETVSLGRRELDANEDSDYTNCTIRIVARQWPRDGGAPSGRNLKREARATLSIPIHSQFSFIIDWLASEPSISTDEYDKRVN